ncbi:hypothetical protein EVG20_g9411 [Dentipellis fragilis]|uniref:C2H2-type domain-containing protein n=1 Tax=Dentipellis fragilis TaxID=205917 RepID=A0A4Y9XY63_9AGAM|nr:hypothetical protein EVG20_g9411 [Dentipellis fragilis]
MRADNTLADHRAPFLVLNSTKIGESSCTSERCTTRPGLMFPALFSTGKISCIHKGMSFLLKLVLKPPSLPCPQRTDQNKRDVHPLSSLAVPGLRSRPLILSATHEAATRRKVDAPPTQARIWLRFDIMEAHQCPVASKYVDLSTRSWFFPEDSLFIIVATAARCQHINQGRLSFPPTTLYLLDRLHNVPPTLNRPMPKAQRSRPELGQESVEEYKQKPTNGFHRCPVLCGKCFSRSWDAKRHFQKVHLQKKIACPWQDCSQTSPYESVIKKCMDKQYVLFNLFNSDDVDRKLYIYSLGIAYECPACPKVLSDRQILQRHIKKKHGYVPYHTREYYSRRGLPLPTTVPTRLPKKRTSREQQSSTSLPTQRRKAPFVDLATEENSAKPRVVSALTEYKVFSSTQAAYDSLLDSRAAVGPAEAFIIPPEWAHGSQGSLFPPDVARPASNATFEHAQLPTLPSTHDSSENVFCQGFRDEHDCPAMQTCRASSYALENSWGWNASPNNVNTVSQPHQKLHQYDQHNGESYVSRFDYPASWITSQQWMPPAPPSLQLLTFDDVRNLNDTGLTFSTGQTGFPAHDMDFLTEEEQECVIKAFRLTDEQLERAMDNFFGREYLSAIPGGNAKAFFIK